MRHGLLRPPMYGEPGGLEGEVTIAELLSDAGYATQAVGKWHMGENLASQPQHVGFDDFYGFLSVSDMYTEWRDPYFFPEVAYSEERTEVDREPAVQQVLRPRHAGRRGRGGGGGHDPGALRSSTTSGPTYSIDFLRRDAGGEQPWFLYHCTRGAHFDNYPLERFLGSSPAKHPYKDTIVELDDIVGRLVRPSRRPASSTTR